MYNPAGKLSASIFGILSKMSPREPVSQTVVIGDRPINLTQVLKLAGAADSGGAAKALIAAGQVKVNGQVELRKRCQMKAGDTVEIEGGPTIVLVAVSGT
jgi:ribosome-associated protein